MTIALAVWLREIVATAATRWASRVVGHAAGSQNEDMRAALGRWAVWKRVGLLFIFHDSDHTTSVKPIRDIRVNST